MSYSTTQNTNYSTQPGVVTSSTTVNTYGANQQGLPVRGSGALQQGGYTQTTTSTSYGQQGAYTSSGNGYQSGGYNNVRASGLTPMREKKKVVVKKQVPKIVKVYKDVEVEEIIEREVPNYIEEVKEEEKIVEVPVERTIKQYKQVPRYMPKEVVREVEEVQTKVVTKVVEVPVQQEVRSSQRQTTEVPFTLDLHLDKLVVRPYENKVIQEEEILKRPVVVDRFEEAVDKEDLDIVITRQVDQVDHSERRTQIPKEFEVIQHVQTDRVELVDRVVQVEQPVDIQKYFEVTQHRDNIVTVDEIVQRPVEQVERVTIPKEFEVTQHREAVETVEEEIPVQVKIFEETATPVEVPKPQFTPVEVIEPQFQNQPVHYDPPVQYSESYRENVTSQTSSYPQFQVTEQPESVDIHVDVQRVQEVPVASEQERPKEYVVERINEVPQTEVITKKVVLTKRTEVPRLNRIYKDEKVIKEVEVVREVIDEQLIEVPEETLEDVPVNLKTTTGRVRVRKIPRNIQLQRITERGVLNPQQKRDFEMTSRRLADLTFEKRKLETLIQFARNVDLSEVNVDQGSFQARIQQVQGEVSVIQRSIQDLIRQRDTLSQQFTVDSEYNFDEQVDESALFQVNSDIEKVQRINEELRQFLANNRPGAPTLGGQAPQGGAYRPQTTQGGYTSTTTSYGQPSGLTAGQTTTTTTTSYGQGAGYNGQGAGYTGAGATTSYTTGQGAGYNGQGAGYTGAGATTSYTTGGQPAGAYSTSNRIVQNHTGAAGSGANGLRGSYTATRQTVTQNHVPTGGVSTVPAGGYTSNTTTTYTTGGQSGTVVQNYQPAGQTTTYTTGGQGGRTYQL